MTRPPARSTGAGDARESVRSSKPLPLRGALTVWSASPWSTAWKRRGSRTSRHRPGVPQLAKSLADSTGDEMLVDRARLSGLLVSCDELSGLMPLAPVRWSGGGVN